MNSTTRSNSQRLIAPLDTTSMPPQIVPVCPLPAQADRHRLRSSPSRSSSILAALCGFGTVRSRYTLAKLRDFDSYSRSTSHWRHAAAILLTPLPSLLTSLLPTLVPLQNPLRGVAANTGFMVHSTITLFLIALGSVFQIRASTGISMSIISNREALGIALLSSVHLIAIVTMAGYTWRFPVPFLWVTAYVPFLLCFIYASILVLRSKLWRDDSVRGPLLGFMPSYVMQSFQVVIYPAFSALFERCDEWQQVLMTMLFPLIKYCFRRGLRLLSSHLSEEADEVAVSGVEICAVMYQSMIMQTAPSLLATLVLIGFDVVQGMYAVHVFMDKHSVVPNSELVDRARTIVCVRQSIKSEAELINYGSIKLPPHLPSITNRRHKPQVQPPPVQTEDERLIVTHALELVQAAESILFTEYFEVTIPIVNAFYILWASQFDSAVYNPKLRPYYHTHALLWASVQSLCVYTVLQALSVVAMHWVMARRFHVSATVLLAYVLERHAWSLQGKLITWLAAIFQLPVVHYGVDFKLKFDFAHGW